MMKSVGRPTEKEYDRLEEIAESLFVGGSWGLHIESWDDGDVHMTAYCTIGTNTCEGYPLNAIIHRQEVIYERYDDICVYRNRVERPHPRRDDILDYRELDF